MELHIIWTYSSSFSIEITKYPPPIQKVQDKTRSIIPKYKYFILCILLYLITTIKFLHIFLYEPTTTSFSCSTSSLFRARLTTRTNFRYSYFITEVTNDFNNYARILSTHKFMIQLHIMIQGQNNEFN